MGKLFGALGIVLLVATSLICEASADGTFVAAGWTIKRYDPPNVCDASGPVSGNVELAIAVMGPQFKLIISSPNFHVTNGTYSVSISIDGGPLVTMNALGDGGVYAVVIVHDLGIALRSASTLTAIVDSKSYAFTVQHADAAMDAASHCASEPTFLESFAHPPQSITGAGDWKLVDHLPGVDHCSLRRNGMQVDTMLERNRNGKLILTAGRGDWAFPTGNVKASLQFDNAPPYEVDASVYDNLVFAPVNDATMERNLLHASQLRWHFPWGDFQASLDGLGVALDALAACDLKKASGKLN